MSSEHRARPTVTPRRGPRPRTTPATPHFQIDQFGPPELHAELWRRMAALDDTDTERSLVSYPTSKAVHLHPDAAHGPRDAFFVGHEFVHLHGDGSGSLHMTLPLDVVAELFDAGWGEPHPAVALGVAPPTSVMVFGPRDGEELELVWSLVRAGYDYARGGGR